MKDSCPFVRSILSAIPTLDLAKFIGPILKNLTQNEYTVHDSFSFASEVSKLDFKSFWLA